MESFVYRYRVGKIKTQRDVLFKKISYFSFIKKLLFTKIFGKERKFTHKEVDTMELKKKKNQNTGTLIFGLCVLETLSHAV